MRVASLSGMPAKTNSILAVFRADHLKTASGMTGLELAIERGRSSAVRQFQALAKRIRHHIAVEEGFVFGLFEARTGLLQDGPTVMMRSEHRKILDRIERLGDLVQKGAPETSLAELRTLRALVEDHVSREEGVIYPACDRLLSPAEIGDAERELSPDRRRGRG